MHIKRLVIRNFRGISALEWEPTSTLCCLIGPGDSGKSTVLDAAEATLSSRWFAFSESDFLACDTNKTIEVEVTIGELSKALKSDERLGLYVRGWSSAGELHDEPEDDDEAVLTVKLTVDATMEPVWELVCERADHPRTLSNRDRALFGLVRLSADEARHLSWAQGSVLSKLTDDTEGAGKHLAQAYRAARDSAKLDTIESFKKAAAAAEGEARILGAYIEGAYGPGLELGRAGFSSGSIALHDSGVPLRLAGLGTKRLATLAIQMSAILEGAVVLIDEIEHGLEPHRIIGAMAHLRKGQALAAKEKRPIGQVLMTSHSSIALAEIAASNIFVVERARVSKAARISAPSDTLAFGKLMKKAPEALFARRILVCEGATEVGILLGLRDFWAAARDGVPIEQLGAALIDGNGTEAPALSCALAQLGYTVALFRDSDRALNPDDAAALGGASVPVYQYEPAMCTEAALFTSAADGHVQALIEYARQEKGDASVNDSLLSRLKDYDAATLALSFDMWDLFGPADAIDLRAVLAAVASDKKWFKELHSGRAIAPIIWDIAKQAPTCALAACLAKTEAWLYA